MPIKWVGRAAFGTAVGLVLWVPAAGAVVFAQAPGSPLTVGTNPRALVVADFNGDGFPDIAVANFGSGGVAVLLGDGSGGFTARQWVTPDRGKRADRDSDRRLQRRRIC